MEQKVEGMDRQRAIIVILVTVISFTKLPS